MTRIVGIALLRNEENFAAWAIGNALDFCDEMIVVDNLSTDRTGAVGEALAAMSPKVRLHRDPNASGTNRYVQDYLGEKVWVFGVDGDEIYDRDGLARLRPRLLAGEYDRYWWVHGHMLHATTVDLESATARGYLTPPAAAPGKLYNFAMIESWTPDRQRLHGVPQIRNDRRRDQLRLAGLVPWERSDLRALHLCFFPRSSIDADIEVRKNITDKYIQHAWRRPVFRALLRLGGISEGLRRYLAVRAMPIKNRNYMRGDVVERRLEGIGRPTDWLGVDAAAAEAEAVLARVSAGRAEEPDLRTELERTYAATRT